MADIDNSDWEAFVWQIKMVRQYVRTTERSTWEPAVLNRAVTEVSEGRMSLRTAAREFGIPKSTLSDRIANGSFKEPLTGRKPTFTYDVEKQLVDHAIKMSDCFYGLTPIDLRKLAFQFAELKEIPHTFNRETEMAGKDWLKGYLTRWPNISIRKPEATSINRAKGFNKEEVQLFFDNLEKILIEDHISPSRIYNVDETGISTVQTPGRIISPRGQKQVGKIVSSERGVTTTVIACISAIGSYIPPMFVFKRKNRNDLLMNGAPSGSIYAVTDSGWSNETIFVYWLKHFISISGASTTAKVLLILDNHGSHSTLQAWNLCRDNGVIMLSLPPHSSHKMQPLDLTVFGPLKKAYNFECDQHMKLTRKAITQYQVAELVKKAYHRTANLEKAVNGFRAAGIVPFNRNIFPEDAFMPSLVFGTIQTGNPSTSIAVSGIESIIEPNATSRSAVEPVTEELLALPFEAIVQASGNRINKPKGHSEILTSSPKKVQLEEREAKRNKKNEELRKKTAAIKRINEEAKNRNESVKMRSNQSKKKGEELKPKNQESTDNEDKLKKSTCKSAQKRPPRLTARKQKATVGLRIKSSKDENMSRWSCLTCNEIFVHPPKEDWIQCGTCEEWCHERCAGKNAGSSIFKCFECKETN